MCFQSESYACCCIIDWNVLDENDNEANFDINPMMKLLPFVVFQQVVPSIVHSLK